MIPVITKLPLARRRESNQQSSWARSGATKNYFTYRFPDKIHLKRISRKTSQTLVRGKLRSTLEIGDNNFNS